MNFLSAISIAGQFDIPEVVLYFGFQLYRGNRTSKMDANGLSAFDSPHLPLAKVGVNIKINWGLVRPSSHKQLLLKDHFCNDNIITYIPWTFQYIRTYFEKRKRFGIANIWFWKCT